MADKLEQVKAWIKADANLRAYVHKVCVEAEADTVDQLARYWPKTFDDLHDTLATLMEDIPQEEMNRWSR